MYAREPMAEPIPPAPTPLRVGIPKEIVALEKRVAATPSSVARIRKLGFDVLIESGAGEAASYLDSAYAEAGAQIVDANVLYAAADIVCKVRAPEPAEVERLKSGATLISFIWPAQQRELLERLQARKLTVLAMDAVPRVTRAQRMDALSAMAAKPATPAPTTSTRAGLMRPAAVVCAPSGRPKWCAASMTAR